MTKTAEHQKQEQADFTLQTLEDQSGHSPFDSHHAQDPSHVLHVD